MKEIEFKSKKNGTYKTIVDDDVFNKLKQLKSLKWSVVIKRNGLVYFQKRLPGNKLVELHRWIMQPKKGEWVDHINKNTLDNRVKNLRICTNSANIRNGRIRQNNKSGHSGVWQDKRSKKWVAEIKVNYKKISLGSSKSFKKAVELRKMAEKKYWNI
jgi:hypothetical protein